MSLQHNGNRHDSQRTRMRMIERCVSSGIKDEVVLAASSKCRVILLSMKRWRAVLMMMCRTDNLIRRFSAHIVARMMRRCVPQDRLTGCWKLARLRYQAAVLAQVANEVIA